MVKFSVFGQGLYNDVEERYFNYLIEPTNKRPDPLKIQTTLACCLLDIAGLQITDKLLSNMKIKKYANRLRHSLLYYNEHDGIWKTIHPRWNIELLSFLYNTETDEDILEERQRYLKNSIDSIFNINNEEIATSVIRTMYVIAAITIDGVTKIPIDIVENVMESQIDTTGYLSNETKSMLYATVIPLVYHELQRYNDVIAKCDKAIELDPNNATAWTIKGFMLQGLKRHEEAIRCYDKAIEIDPNDVHAWNEKCNALKALGRYEEADQLIKDRSTAF